MQNTSESFANINSIIIFFNISLLHYELKLERLLGFTFKNVTCILPAVKKCPVVKN